MFKTIATAALTALVVVMLSGLVGGNQPGVGGDTRFPNSTLGAAALDIAGAATFGSPTASSSVNFGKACWTVTTDVGSTTYVYFTGVGTNSRLATSTTSCL